jgi:hypothetical protein
MYDLLVTYGVSVLDSLVGLVILRRLFPELPGKYTRLVA